MKKVMIAVLMISLLSVFSFGEVIEVPSQGNLNGYDVYNNPGKAVFIEILIENIDSIQFVSSNKKEAFKNKLDVFINTLNTSNYIGMANKIKNDLLPRIKWMVNANQKKTVEILLEYSMMCYFEKLDTIALPQGTFDQMSSILVNSIAPSIIREPEKPTKLYHITNSCHYEGEYHYVACRYIAVFEPIIVR